MTLVAAWVRTIRNTKHLVVASDSRLTGGMKWDCCPKIMPLNRGDSVICFAGATYYAYPIILQVSMMVNMHDKINSRAMDISELQPSITNIMNTMLQYRDDFPTCGADIPDVKFLFAGFSWRYSRFMIWVHEYSQANSMFVCTRVKKNFDVGSGFSFWFMGDNEREATDSLVKELSKTRTKGKPYKIDMEPFDVLMSYCSDKKCHEIGGPIQLVKIYKHMNYVPFNVLWPDRNGNKTLLGRPLLDYERNKFLTIDASSKRITDPWGSEIEHNPSE